MTALLSVLLAVVMIGVLAFVSDFGFAYANQRRIQSGVDAAALAVGHRIAVTAPRTATCEVISAAFNTVGVRSYAADVFSKNVGSSATLDAGADGFSVACTSSRTVVVTVKGEQDSPTFLGGILGQSKVAVSQQARVVVGALGTVVGLRPFALCQTFANTLRSAPTLPVAVPVTNSGGGCGIAPGNWAMLDFDGGSNAAGDQRDWIANGYDGPISAAPPVQISGDPGFNVNSADDEMDTMFSGPDVVLPVYSSVTGNGGNSLYTISGFVSVTPCRYRINNRSGPAASSVDPSCGPLPLSLPADYIQVRFSSFIPVGALNLTCALGNSACDTGPRSAELAD